MNWSRVVPVLAVGVGAALWQACGNDEEVGSPRPDGGPDGGVANKACFNPNGISDPTVGQGETVYRSTDHVVVVDNQIKPTTAEFYLTTLPNYADKMLNFFRIPSPWSDRMRLVLRDSAHPLGCQPHAIGCAHRGIMTVHLSSEAFARVNDAAREGNIYAEGVFAHEMSHVLRGGIASPWWGLEEGLARYTEREMLPTPEPAGTARKIFDESVTEDSHYEVPILPDTLNSAYLQSLEVYSCPDPDPGFPDRGVPFRYRLKEGVTPEHDEDTNQPTITVFATPFELYDLVLQVDHVVSTRIEFGSAICTFDLKIHQRSLGADLQPNDLRKTRECKDNGIVETQEVKTDDGTPLLREVSSPQPYVALDSYVRGENSEVVENGMYDTGYCFWKTIEKNYGDRAVNKILLSMVAFSQQHQEAPADFAFLQTVMKFTGMDETQAREFFRRFSAPTEERWYPLGGICWAP